MKTFFFTLFIVWLNLNSNLLAQPIDHPIPKHSITPLKVGEEIPNLLLSPIINYQEQSARTKDFKDKLLILDFWATWCVPCIRPFPKLDSLQRKFQGKVQFMPITYEKKELIDKFFARLKSKRDYVLPSVVEDTTTWKYFGETVAQYVWIFQGRIVAYTQGNDALTEENIELVLSGKKFDNTLQQSIDEGVKLPDDFSKSLLNSRRANPAKQVMLLSSVGSYIRGLRTNVSVKTSQPEDPTSGIRLINLPLSFLYLQAHQLFPITQVSLEMADPGHFDPPKNQQDSTNLYSYELIFRGANKSELYGVMQQDLKRVFGYKITREKRLVNVAVLKKSREVKLSTKGGAPESDYTNFYLTLKNQPFAYLVSRLEHYLIGETIRFIVDETGISENVDLSIDANFSDPLSLGKELQKYGLNLAIEPRKMDMYVISDKK